MAYKRHFCTGALAVLTLLSSMLCPLTAPVQAEWYVAGQIGMNFADALTNVEGTGPLSGLVAPDFDLKNSVSAGGKIGVFPFHGALGLELDAFYSSPHVKNLDEIPGIHLAVTNIGMNVMLRYPGKTFQPYVGIGPAILVARLSNSATTQEDTDVAVGLNIPVGIRAFVHPNVALFTEYKYTEAKLGFNGAFGAFGGFASTYRAHQLFLGVSYHF